MRWRPVSDLRLPLRSTGRSSARCARAPAHPDAKNPRGTIAPRGFIFSEYLSLVEAPDHQSIILMTLRVRGSTITRRSFTTAYRYSVWLGTGRNSTAAG